MKIIINKYFVFKDYMIKTATKGVKNEEIK